VACNAGQRRRRRPFKTSESPCIKAHFARHRRLNDCFAQAQYQLEQEKTKTQHLTNTLKAKTALLKKVSDLQKAAELNNDASAEKDEEMTKLVEYLSSLQNELQAKKNQLASQRKLYHDASIEGRRVEEVLLSNSSFALSVPPISHCCPLSLLSRRWDSTWTTGNPSGVISSR